MKGNFAWFGRLALTVIVVVAALAVGRELWVYYMESPGHAMGASAPMWSRLRLTCPAS